MKKCKVTYGSKMAFECEVEEDATEQDIVDEMLGIVMQFAKMGKRAGVKKLRISRNYEEIVRNRIPD